MPQIEAEAEQVQKPGSVVILCKEDDPGFMIRPRLPVSWRMRTERNRLGHASADPLQHAGHDLMVCDALAWIEIPSGACFLVGAIP
jgi:hypothetical protein